MARVSEAEVREYQRACEAAEAGAVGELSEALALVDLSSEAAAAFVLEVVYALYGDYGRALAELGRQFYQWCRNVETDGAGDYRASTTWDGAGRLDLGDDVRESLRRARAGELTEGEAADVVSRALGNYSHKASRDAIRENIRAERAQQRSRGGRQTLGYARVPRPGCTCAFCITMASRGFVYRSQSSAGLGTEDRYHLGCRCTVVPLDLSDPTIEGYDERPYLASYEAARDALRDGSLPREVYERVKRAEARAGSEGRDFGDINRIEIAMRAMYGMH